MNICSGHLCTSWFSVTATTSISGCDQPAHRHRRSTRCPTKSRKRCRPWSCHGPEDYRLEEVPVPERRPGRGAGQGRGRRHLRQRPEVLPRRGEVLGRREPPGLGGDRGHPRPRVRRRASSNSTTRPPPGGASRSATEWSSEQIVPCWECRYCKRGQYHMCQPHDIYGFKRRTPGAMASYMVYPGGRLGAQGHPATSPRPRRVRRAAVVLAARRRARAASPSTTPSWWPAAGPIGLGMIAGRPRQVPGAGDRPRHGAGQARSWPRSAAPTSRSTSPSEDAVSDHQGPHRRLRRRRLPGGHRPSLRCSPGPQPAAQAGHLRRVQRLRQRRERRLEHHQRRQGTRRPRRAPRPALLARRRSG